MLFSTANSSFIFDLRRRSIRLCAVFLAIFRPATLVADGCFFLDEADSPVAGAAAVAVAAGFLLAPVGPFPALVDSVGFRSSCVRGFIWMIFRDRVGGGGNANESFPPALLAAGAAEDLFRDLTTSLGCMGYGVLGDVWDPGDSGVFILGAWDRDPPAEFMAGGGSSKAS